MFNLFRRKEKPWIQFLTYPGFVDAIPHPVPAQKALPEWFKNLKADCPVGSDPRPFPPPTIKRCVPALDGMSQGFIIHNWADLAVVVRETTDEQREKGSGPLEVGFSYHDNFNLGMGKETIEGHSWDQVGDECGLSKYPCGKQLIKMINPWSIRTPKGWSIKVQNPSNHFSNDLHFIEAVIDTDEFNHTVNFPFVWTGNKVGRFLIPRGVPLVQIVPFRRETVALKTGTANQAEINRLVNQENKLSCGFRDMYRNEFWHKRKQK